jgi:Predicted permease
MFGRKKTNNNEINKQELNDVISLGKKILRVLYVFAFLAILYTITIVIKEWQVKEFVVTILKIVSPLFIGLGIAWLFDPFVKWLVKKGVRRSLGTLITYFIFLGIVAIIVGSIIPILFEQINEFAKSVPAIIDTLKGWIDGFLGTFSDIEGFDPKSFRADVFKGIGEIGTGLTNDLPTITMNIFKVLISGIGNILIGLVIGFYLLMSFDGVNETVVTIIPKRFRKNTRQLMEATNASLRKFVEGAVLDGALIFIVTSLALWAVGLKAPMLFGLFCGITNVIPYAGPYIGGAPAVIVGFSQSPTIGILTLISIVVIQFIEGNFFQPLIMSKTTKLHPVTIMLGLLIFGHFFGIIGMVISTPLIAIIKVVFEFFDEKYNILNLNNEIEEEEK